MGKPSETVCLLSSSQATQQTKVINQTVINVVKVSKDISVNPPKDAVSGIDTAERLSLPLGDCRQSVFKKCGINRCVMGQRDLRN